jgi:sec-independent protein translocase protein TatB
MFDIGWSEILIVGVVAVVAIGPKELPNTMRSLGRGVNKLRRMAGEFQGQFNQALKEANLEDVKKEFDVLRQSAASISGAISPVGMARNALSSSIFTPETQTPLPSAIASGATVPDVMTSGFVAQELPMSPIVSAPPSLMAGLEHVVVPSAFAPLPAFQR